MTSELSPAQPTSGNSFTSRTTLVDNRETSPTRSGTGRLRGMEEGKSPVRPARRGKVAKVSMLQRVFSLCAAILSFFRSLPATVPTFFGATVPAFFRSLRKPAEEVGPIPGFKESVRAIVFNSWLNLLLFFIPVCWVLHWVTPQQYAAIFSTGFLAIIPLAKLLSFATDELSLRMAGTLAGLVNATLGNVVELIVAVIALKKCELGIVQSSLIGFMLSNLLLVLGMCFFFGGLKFSEQAFEGFVTQVNSSLLMFALAAVLLPAVFHWQTTQNLANEAARNATQAATTNATQVALDHIEATQAQIIQFSRGIAIILLVVYIGYMGLSLFTHASIYSQETGDSTPYAPKAQGVTIPRVAEPESIALEDANADGSTVEGQAPTLVEEVEEDDPETPQLNGRTCFGLMILVTVLVAITAEFLVGSIDGLTESGKISKEFVGMVLLPIVGNAAEHVSAVTVAVKDKMNLSIGVAVGSSIQIGLFVIPFSVLVAWGMDKPMTLLFDPFEAACLALAVVTVNYCVADGKSNWLEGMILMSLYAMLGTLFFCYTGVDVADHFATCT
ncbi:calcium/proton exchanger [Mycena olivaceomarginata]|nr:calcium/proton exchanger [Mycena olivaceomarginata]